MGTRISARRALRALFVCALASTLTVTGQSALAAKAGPAIVAKADRHLWPEKMSTEVGFDKASRAAILLYALALEEAQKMPDESLREALGVNSLQRPSVDRFFVTTRALLTRNYQLASATCTVTDWTCAAANTAFDDLQGTAVRLLANAPVSFQAWRADMEAFAHVYLAEQLRLAAIFPKASSEIATFGDREWNGDDLPDRQFFLTFDDGPTADHGNTDEVMRMLDAEKKSAAFFVLGQNLQNRANSTGAAAVSALYSHQCVASHGWEHHSHARWDQWQDSVKRTQSLIAATVTADHALALFRPPYGQRTPDSEAFFSSQSLRVALWNLDSQDWSSHMETDAVAGRVIALMLIKRHGVLLFHDIHRKAKVALPVIFREVGAGVQWADCHGLAHL